ncbi:MAG: hypothetical protein ACR2JC_04730 [Chloroflexota bacterium]
MTGKLTIINRTGHATVTWSPDLQETVDEANRVFNEMLALGYTAFSLHGTHSGSQIAEFDAAVEDVLLVPRMVGG